MNTKRTVDHTFRLKQPFLDQPAGTELTDDNTNVIVPTNVAKKVGRTRTSYHCVQVPIAVAKAMIDTFEPIKRNLTSVA